MNKSLKRPVAKLQIYEIQSFLSLYMHVKTVLRTSTGKPVSFKSNITVTPVRARCVGASSIDITPVFPCLTLIQIYKVIIQ